MIKNTAGQKIGAQMITASDGSAFTGTTTVYVTVDAGTQTLGTVGSGVCTHEGNGLHTYAPSQAETNGDLVEFTFIGTGAIPATLHIYTRGGDAFTRIGAAGAGLTALGDTRIANLDATVSSRLATAGYTAPPTATDNAIEVWDRVISAANHNIAGSAGRRLRTADSALEVHSGLAQAGTTTSLTLDTGASAVNDVYKGDRIVITAGTGVGQHGIVTAYNGTTKVATVSKTWVTTPDVTSEFVLVPADVDAETWNGVAVTGDGDWAELQLDVDDILVDTGTSGVIVATNNDKTGYALTAGTGLGNQTSNITGNLSGSVGSVTGAVGSVTAGVTVTTNNDKTGYAIGAGGIASSAFAAGAINAAALNADAVDEIFDEQIGDSTVTMRQALKAVLAATVGKLSGAATTTISIRNVADDTNVIVATVDADGNRSAVTLTL